MRNIILWMPNTVLILDKNEPLTPSSFSIIQTSCLSKVSTGENNLLGCWVDPLHSLFSLSQLSSHVMHNLRRPQDLSQCPLPTKKISVTTSSPGFCHELPKEFSSDVWWRWISQPGPLSTEMLSITGAGLDQGWGPLLLWELNYSGLPATFSHSYMQGK